MYGPSQDEVIRYQQTTDKRLTKLTSQWSTDLSLTHAHIHTHSHTTYTAGSSSSPTPPPPTPPPQLTMNPTITNIVHRIREFSEILLISSHSPQTWTRPEPAKSMKTNLPKSKPSGKKEKMCSRVAVKVPLQNSYGDQVMAGEPAVPAADQKNRARLG